MKWLDDEEKLKEAIRTRGKNTKKLSSGWPLKLKEFDTGLAQWIKERRAQKQKITYNLIKQEAAWYDGVTKDNVINSFKACGVGAIGGADDHLIHCLKDGNRITNGLYELTKAREAAEEQELAALLHGFEIEAPEEDDTGHVSDVEVIDDESAASDEENSDQEDVNHNLSDDSDF